MVVELPRVGSGGCSPRRSLNQVPAAPAPDPWRFPVHALTHFPRALARFGTLLTCASAVAVIGLPAAHAADSTVRQSAPVDSAVVSNQAVTPLGTCIVAHVCEIP